MRLKMEIKRDGVVVQLRLLLAEWLLGLAMSVAPDGTEEKLDIVAMVSTYFKKQVIKNGN